MNAKKELACIVLVPVFYSSFKSSVNKVISRSLFSSNFLSGSFNVYSATIVGDMLRLNAYSTTASSLVAHKITPTLGFSLVFLTSRSRDSK